MRRGAWTAAFLLVGVAGCLGLGGGFVLPQRNWHAEPTEVEALYRAVAVPGAGAVVTGPQWVARYSLRGELLWTINYPGVPHGVTLGPEGTLAVAGTGGLLLLSLQGGSVRHHEGRFVAAAFAQDGALWGLEDTGLRRLDAEVEAPVLPYPGTATSLAVVMGRAVIGGSAGAVNYDLTRNRLTWTAPYPGRIEDLALDQEGNLYLVGSAGLYAYDSRGDFLWRWEFPGEARAIAILEREDAEAWVLVGGTMRHQGRLHLLLVALTPDGDVAWELREGMPDAEVLGFDLASDPLKGCLYAVGAIRSQAAAVSRGLALQYVFLPPPATGCRQPWARIEGPAEPVRVGQEVHFRNLSQAGEGYLVAWAWDFGDGHTAQVWSPTHVYERPGVYVVTLTVFDDRLCSSEARTVVEVVERVEVVEEAPVVLGVVVDPSITADFTWTVVPEVYGSYPEGFLPHGPTALDLLKFTDLSRAGPVLLQAKAVCPDGAPVHCQWDLNGDGQFDAQGDTISWTFDEPKVHRVTLVVTCPNGKSAVHGFLVDAREFQPIRWSWAFGDGTSSDSQHPEHHYLRKGTYAVVLTVYNAQGDSDTARRSLTVVNVPPVAKLTWSFEAPKLPPCEEVFGDCEEDEVSGCFCANPVVPENTGPLHLDGTLSHDGEPWLDLASWEWQVVLNGLGSVECQDCESLKPVYHLRGAEGPYFRGEAEVTLWVWDQDGEGGDDYPFSRVWRPVVLANIPPYAGFDWALGWSFSYPNCGACAKRFGTGDPYAEVTVGTVTVARAISWTCFMDGEESGILAPWWRAWVDLLIEGEEQETVTLVETVPEGWSYELVVCPDCVEAELEAGRLVLRVNLAECPWGAQISYVLHPPSGPVEMGAYTVRGDVTVQGQTGVLESTVILCAIVDVYTTLILAGKAWDPNGDEIVAWAWFLRGGGQQWASEGQDFWVELNLEELVCSWDEDLNDWVWTFDIDEASLTVTDSGGASTAVEGRIRLRGRPGGPG